MKVGMLKEFSSVVNRNKLTDEIYNFLLKKFDLDKINLDDEFLKIQTKTSTLSKSRRDAVGEFLRLRDLLNAKKAAAEKLIVMNNESSNQNETIIGSNDDIITNIHDVESMSEIN